ncbi:MAG: hypothetical protein ACPGN3_12320 [Opitutales bacterium]
MATYHSRKTVRMELLQLLAKDYNGNVFKFITSLAHEDCPSEGTLRSSLKTGVFTDPMLKRLANTIGIDSFFLIDFEHKLLGSLEAYRAAEKPNRKAVEKDPSLLEKNDLGIPLCELTDKGVDKEKEFGFGAENLVHGGFLYDHWNVDHILERVFKADIDDEIRMLTTFPLSHPRILPRLERKLELQSRRGRKDKRCSVKVLLMNPFEEELVYARYKLRSDCENRSAEIISVVQKLLCMQEQYKHVCDLEVLFYTNMPNWSYFQIGDKAIYVGSLPPHDAAANGLVNLLTDNTSDAWDFVERGFHTVYGSAENAADVINENAV